MPDIQLGDILKQFAKRLLILLFVIALIPAIFAVIFVDFSGKVYIVGLLLIPVVVYVTLMLIKGTPFIDIPALFTFSGLLKQYQEEDHSPPNTGRIQINGDVSGTISTINKQEHLIANEKMSDTEESLLRFEKSFDSDMLPFVIETILDNRDQTEIKDISVSLIEQTFLLFTGFMESANNFLAQYDDLQNIYNNSDRIFISEKLLNLFLVLSPLTNEGISDENADKIMDYLFLVESLLSNRMVSIILEITRLLDTSDNFYNIVSAKENLFLKKEFHKYTLSEKFFASKDIKTVPNFQLESRIYSFIKFTKDIEAWLTALQIAGNDANEDERNKKIKFATYEIALSLRERMNNRVPPLEIQEELIKSMYVHGFYLDALLEKDIIPKYLNSPISEDQKE